MRKPSPLRVGSETRPSKVGSSSRRWTSYSLSLDYPRHLVVANSGLNWESFGSESGQFPTTGARIEKIAAKDGQSEQMNAKWMVALSVPSVVAILGPGTGVIAATDCIIALTGNFAYPPGAK